LLLFCHSELWTFCFLFAGWKYHWSMMRVRLPIISGPVQVISKLIMNENIFSSYFGVTWSIFLMHRHRTLVWIDLKITILWFQVSI
jgi:hypothetical protein